MSLRLCFETRAPAGRIASSSTRSASLGEFWTQVDSSLAAVDALKTLGAPARGLPWTCRFVVISTFYFAYEIARYALSKRELRSRVNAHAPATTLRYRPKIVLLRVFQAGAACRSACRSTPTPPRASPPRSTVSSCTTGRVCSVDIVFFGAAAAVWLNGLLHLTN